jgi:hypothetical protein
MVPIAHTLPLSVLPALPAAREARGPHLSPAARSLGLSVSLGARLVVGNRLGLAVLFGSLICSLARPVHAGDAPRLRVCVTHQGTSALISEAELRIQGELSAAGFELVESGPREGSAGSSALAVGCPSGVSELSIGTNGAKIVVTASVVGRGQPLEQMVEAPVGGIITPEIVAVRAVETLRAAALDVAAAPKTPTEQAWADFAQGRAPAKTQPSDAHGPASAPSEAPARGQASAGATASTNLEDTRSKDMERPWAFGVALGAQGVSDAFCGVAALTFDYQIHSISLGARANLSFSPERTDTPTAGLLLRPYGADLRAMWTPRLRGPFELALGVEAGVIHVRMDAVERTGSPQRFESANHTGLELGAGTWFGYRFAPDLSVRLEGWVASWIDAPELQVATSEVVLGRPAWIVTLGPIFRR